jgi:glycosyltransferase involved in cell wall biosynthesis
MTINGSGPNDRASPTAPFTLSDSGRNVAKGHLAIDTETRWDGTDVPLVSCLMVTTDRPRLAARAIECFLAQSYPNRELIVIDSGESDDLQQGIEAICYPPIKPHRERPDARSMGELRDLAVEKSSGQYVCVWDDDDLYDPDRLSIQMSAITSLGADACFLARLQLWWPARRVLAVSIRRMWEGTMICAKNKMPLYPPLRRGEDTPVAYRLWRSQRVVMLDEPRLYTYVFHGANTTGESHFAAHCGAATERWTGDAYADRLAILGARVPIDVDEPTSTQNENHDTRSSPASPVVPTTDITLSADTW